MQRTVLGGVTTLAALAVALVLTGRGVVGQSGASSGEWPTYGGDLANSR